MNTKGISLKEFSKLTNEICRIEVENARLTAQYYNVYMGFEIVGVNKSSTLYLIRLFEHLLYIVGSTKKTERRNIDVQLNSKHLVSFYYSIIPGVKVDKPLYELEDGVKCFSIIDCNENIVCFSSI